MRATCNDSGLQPFGRGQAPLLQARLRDVMPDLIGHPGAHRRRWIPGQARDDLRSDTVGAQLARDLQRLGSPTVWSRASTAPTGALTSRHARLDRASRSVRRSWIPDQVRDDVSDRHARLDRASRHPPRQGDETGVAEGRSDQAALLGGEADEVVVVAQREGLHQTGAVGFHGLDADAEQVGHLAGGVALADQAQQLALPRG